MSGEKIDLREVEQDVRFMHDPDVLALVAAVRAARNLDGRDHGRSWDDLCAALSPFTDSQASPGAGEAPDSAEVRDA